MLDRKCTYWNVKPKDAMRFVNAGNFPVSSELPGGGMALH